MAISMMTFSRYWAGPKTRRAVSLLCFILMGAVPSLALDVDRIKPSIVRIFSFGEGEDEIVTGSGFVVSNKGDSSIVATNAHVVAGRSSQSKLMILRKAGKNIEVYEGIVFSEDTSRDLALVRVPKLRARALPLFRPDPSQGEEVFALGFPGIVDDWDSIVQFGKLFQSASSHILNDPTGTADRIAEATLSKDSVRRVVNGKWDPSDPMPEFRIIEHDVNITAGNSGGPLVNACGHVVGINTMRIPDGNLPMDVVRKSSHSIVLIDILNRQGIKCVIASSPCNPSGQIGTLGTTGLLVVLAAAAMGIAVFFAVRRPAVIAETYTQFLRRMPGQKPDHKHGFQPPPESRVRTHPPSKQWILEGINPESGQRADIAIPVDPSKCRSGKLIIGRRMGAVHLHIPNTSISGQHATLLVAGANLQIEDRNSSNGTKVNGVSLKPFVPVELSPGDRVELGEVKLQIRQG
jgi:hypothetical protein